MTFVCCRLYLALESNCSSRSFVEKLRVCFGTSTTNWALLPVTPREVTFTMEYSADKEGSRAADTANLCRVT